MNIPPKHLLPLLAALVPLAALPAPGRPPNVILILTDDQGFNDVGCFGSKTIRTPQLDALAGQGIRLTSFLMPSPVCSPSRAGLLTGCYPKRVGMHRHVIFPATKHGMHPEEITIADLLSARGYATACIGKWHVGHRPEILPRRQGFDSYFGIPYSNDMEHPDRSRPPRGPRPGPASDESWVDQKNSARLWHTPLLENEEIIELPVDQRTITRRYTDRAIRFIKDHRDRPFFLYLSHSMPHIPLYVPDDAFDPDPANAYTCVIEHLDTEIGRVTKVLAELGLTNDTLVIFTSDNGPHRSKNHGGSAAPLRGGKRSTFEGGLRVPFIAAWPGKIPAGTCSDELASAIDLLPTIASLTGIRFDPPRMIDGLDLSLTLTTLAPSPRSEFLYYSARGDIQGIRQGDWKLLVQRTRAEPSGALLFNLRDDPGESDNLAGKHPDRVATLRTRMIELDRQLTVGARPAWNDPAKPPHPQN